MSGRCRRYRRPPTPEIAGLGQASLRIGADSGREISRQGLDPLDNALSAALTPYVGQVGVWFHFSSPATPGPSQEWRSRAGAWDRIGAYPEAGNPLSGGLATSGSDLPPAEHGPLPEWGSILASPTRGWTVPPKLLVQVE